jgi:hypothetical protein
MNLSWIKAWKVQSLVYTETGNHGLFKRHLGIFESKEKMVAGAHYHYIVVVGHPAGIRWRVGNSSVHIYLILKHG